MVYEKKIRRERKQKKESQWVWEVMAAISRSGKRDEVKKKKSFKQLGFGRGDLSNNRRSPNLKNPYLFPIPIRETANSGKNHTPRTCPGPSRQLVLVLICMYKLFPAMI